MKKLYMVLAVILFCGCKQEVSMTFQAGTYEVTTQGQNGDIEINQITIIKFMITIYFIWNPFTNFK